MQIYIDIIKFSFLRFITYPLEILGLVAYKILTTIFLIFFWSIAAKTSANPIDLKQLTSYFLISGAFAELVMINPFNYAKTLEKGIKNGEINQYLIRPVKILPYLYSLTLGNNGLGLLVALVSLALGLLIHPVTSFANVVLCLCFLLAAMVISAGISISIGTVAFYTTEASGIRNAVTHVVRIVSGLFVPLSYFTDYIAKILSLLPFPYIIFGPVQALQTEFIDFQLMKTLGISIFWAIIIISSSIYFWNKAIKNYEAIGI